MINVIGFNKASDDDDADHDDDDDVIVIICTCAVLSPKCLKLLHSSSLQEGNLKERYFLYFCIFHNFCIFYIFVFLFYVFCIPFFVFLHSEKKIPPFLTAGGKSKRKILFVLFVVVFLHFYIFVCFAVLCFLYIFCTFTVHMKSLNAPVYLGGRNRIP